MSGMVGKRRDVHGNHSVWLRKRWYVSREQENQSTFANVPLEKSILSRANSVHASLLLLVEEREVDGSTSRLPRNRRVKNTSATSKEQRITYKDHVCAIYPLLDYNTASLYISWN